MNQHYLSQFYLKWFRADDIGVSKECKCYFFDVKKEKPVIKLQKIDTIWCGWNLFSKEDSRNKYNHDLEKEFGKLESRFSLLFEKITINANAYIREKKKSQFISNKEKILLVDYIKFQYKRSIIIQGDFRPGINNVYGNIINCDIPKMKEQVSEGYKNKIDELGKLLEKNQDKNTKNFGIDVISQLFNDNELFKESLLSKNWFFKVIEDKDKSFVTSDFPIYRYNEPWEMNWLANPTTSIFFSISKNILLLISWEWDRIIVEKENNSNSIKAMNGAIIANADNIIISSNKKLLEKMMEWKTKRNTKYYFEKNSTWCCNISNIRLTFPWEK